MAKELISSGRFFAILQRDYKGIIEKNNINYWEDFSDTSESGVVFKDIEITEAINLESYYSLNIKVKFIDSKIPFVKLSTTGIRDLVLINSSINTLIIDNRVSLRKLSLQDKSGINNVTINNNSSIRELNLLNESYINKISLENQSKVHEILMDNSRINELKIDFSILSKFTVVNKSTINGFEVLNKSKINEIVVEKSTTDNIIVDESEINQINIIESESKDLKIDKSSKIEKIHLSQTTFTGVELFNNSYISILTINDNSKIGDFNLEKSSIFIYEVLEFSRIGSFNCSNSTVEKFKLNKSNSEDINIDKDSTIKEFKIENYSKSGNLLFREVDIKKIDITMSLTKDITSNKVKSKSTQINIKHTVIGDLILFEGEYDEILLSACIVRTFRIDKIEVKKDIKILSDSRVWNLWIQGEKNKKIFVKSSYIQKLNWNQETICMLSINRCEVESFFLEQTSIPKDSVFQMSDSSINLFKSSMFVNTAWFNISNLQPLKKYKCFVEENENIREKIPKILDSFGQCENIIYYLFEDKINPATIHLENSDMGKTSFVDCKLKEFDAFIYYNTKMLEVYVGGTQLPTKIELPKEIKEKDKEQKELKEQERLAFGQFKKIYDNRGDSVSASEYLALELDAYTEQNITWSERLNLKLNKCSSNYGNDWWKATKITILINSVFFFIYCMLLGYSIGTDWRKALELASYSFEYLNPLRKADFIDTSKPELEPALHFENIKWLARFWDYFSRIVIAYFVYQTIQAFRRFGKTK